MMNNINKETFSKMIQALNYSLSVERPVEFTTEDGGKMVVGIDTGEPKNIDYLFEEYKGE